MLKRIYWPTLWWAILPFLAFACGSNYSFEERRGIAEASWTYADSLQYDFQINDSLQIYNLHLVVEHTDDFPFENLYVRLHTIFPDGNRLSEVVSLQLSDDVDRWLGSRRGDTYQLDIPIQQGAYFNQVGAYQLVVEQFSRREQLSGVQAITFALEKTDNQRES